MHKPIALAVAQTTVYARLGFYTSLIDGARDIGPIQKLLESGNRVNHADFDCPLCGWLYQSILCAFLHRPYADYTNVESVLAVARD